MTGVQTCALPICLWDDRLSEEFVFSVNPSSDGGSFGVVRPVAYKSVCASYRDSLGVDRVGTVVFAVAAAVQSGNDAEWERRIEAMKALGWLPNAAANLDYLADMETEHDDG